MTLEVKKQTKLGGIEVYVPKTTKEKIYEIYYGSDYCLDYVYDEAEAKSIVHELNKNKKPTNPLVFDYYYYREIHQKGGDLYFFLACKTYTKTMGVN